MTRAIVTLRLSIARRKAGLRMLFVCARQYSARSSATKPAPAAAEAGRAAAAAAAAALGSRLSRAAVTSVPARAWRSRPSVYAFSSACCASSSSASAMTSR